MIKKELNTNDKQRQIQAILDNNKMWETIYIAIHFYAFIQLLFSINGK